ncbi:MAG: hypothetical protein HYY45_15190 [Deltaproteobacteria bacterium]|nr:hypothetical protein [Deltaproteobacteria bacterium]
MNREQRLLLISILLLVGVAVYYLRPGWVALLRGRKTLTVAARSSAESPAPQGIVIPNLPPVSVPSETVDERTPWGRNPFLTEEEEATKGKKRGSDGLQIKAIIVGRPKSVATIDGRTVAVGEKVGEETVWEIHPDAVVLERDGHKRILKVSEPAVSVEVKEGKK